jgi:hypothetical protein
MDFEWAVFADRRHCQGIKFYFMKDAFGEVALIGMASH